MERVIALEGATNVRDLGGYRTRDGRIVRWRRLFRADGLHRLTGNDHRILTELGIAAAYDLRYGPERAGEPARLPAEIRSVHIGLADRPEASFLDSLGLGGVPTVENAADYLLGAYDRYPELYADACRTLLEHLSEPGNGPCLFHCTAGKDRTGFAAALILSALGVPYETVLEDYLLTNAHWGSGRTRARGPAARTLRAGLRGPGGLPRGLLRGIGAGLGNGGGLPRPGDRLRGCGTGAVAGGVARALKMPGGPSPIPSGCPVGAGRVRSGFRRAARG